MRKFCFLFILFLSCAAQSFEIQTGDLLFQIGAGSGFEKAVASATSGRKNLPFTHVGAAERTEGGVSVWEASPQGGVKRTPLAEFLADALKNPKGPAVQVFRLKRKYRKWIPGALARVRALEGRPYDFLFLPDNPAYYCSELVQAAFLDGDGVFLFPSAPMNFKDKETGEISPFWMNYFRVRGVEIPQGVPGTNPGDLSKSKLLKKVYSFF